jgi:hypothetical protein
MKKFSFFFITPTLLLLTIASCNGMELAHNKKSQLIPKIITLTHTQQTQHFPKNDWVLVSGPKEERYAMHAERPYCDTILTKVSYQPTHITLNYSDTKTNHVYASSSFNVPEHHNTFTCLRLNLSFFDDKSKIIIALEDTGFILPVPFKVMYDTSITKKHFSYLQFAIKTSLDQHNHNNASPEDIVSITKLIMKKLYKSYKRI